MKRSVSIASRDEATIGVKSLFGSAALRDEDIGALQGRWGEYRRYSSSIGAAGTVDWERRWRQRRD